MGDITTRPTLPGTTIDPTPEEVAQGIILKSYEDTPSNGDLRLKKTGNKLYFEQYISGSWKKNQSIGSLETALIQLNQDYSGGHSDVIGIENIENLGEIDQRGENIWRLSSTPDGMEYGNNHKKLFLSSITHDDTKLVIPSDSYTYQINTSFAETSPAATSYEWTQTFPGDKPFFVTTFSADLVTTAEGRLIITDIVDDRVIYKSTGDAAFLIGEGVQIPAGYISETLVHPLYLIPEREYKYRIEFDVATQLKGSTISSVFVPHSEAVGHYIDTKIFVAQDAWSAKTWNNGDMIVQDGKLYICNVTGTQITDFANNSSKWDELGSILTELAGYTEEQKQINLSSLGTTVIVSTYPDILERDSGDITKLKIKNSFILRTVDSSDPVNISISDINVPITTGISHTIPLGQTWWIGIKEIAMAPFFELIFNPEYTDFDSSTVAIVGRADTDATIPGQLSTVRNSPYVAHDLTRTAYDYMAVRDNTFLISGGDITPTYSEMTYTTEESQYWRFMTWIGTSNRNYGLEPTLLQTRYDTYNRTGGFESPSTLEEGYYDNNGVKTVVPANKWAITKVYHFAISNVNGHQRGKQFYDSLFDAQSRKGEENSPAHLDFTGAVLTHLIYIKSGATDADNTEEVVFEKVTPNNISSSGDPVVGGLQQSGVIDWVGSDILTINADPTTFDRGEFRIGFVNRETGVRFVRTVEAETDIIIDNLTVNPFTFYGYNITTDSFIQQSTPMDRTTLDNIIPIGRLWHRNKTIIDETQTMPLVVETSHDYAGQLLAFGALKQSGLNLVANGTNKKVDLAEGILEVLGGTSTSRENISNAQPASKIPLIFTPVHKAVTTSKVVFETVTDNPDYDVFDDGSGTLATLSPNNFGLHYFYIFPFRETVNVFLIRGDESYATLVDAQKGLQQNPIPIPSDFQNGFPFAIVIAKKGTDNLPIAITAGDAVIVSADRFGSFGAGGGGSIGGVAKFIDNIDTPDTYVDQAGKFPVVNSTENGLVFTEVESSTSILFDNFDFRFFGELGLPNLQTWTETVTGSATVDLVPDTVFGESKNVVKINDDVTNGFAGVNKALTLEYWEDIQSFGASYGGVSRLDTDNGSEGFFSGLQADAPENPLDAINRRYGMIFKKDGDYLKLEEVGNITNNITFDGLSGRERILFDEWFKWETVIPTGLTFSIVYINCTEALTISFRPNVGGLGTKSTIGSGSTGGIDRISYHENFGVTIYKESPNKLLSVETMATDKITIITPSGKRDYIITIPDDNPRDIGDALGVLANNIGGSITLKSQDLNAPQILFNGLNSILIDITENKEVRFINTIENGNVYQAILSRIEAGIAGGQMAYWDNAINQWKYSETSELYWDDTNKRLGVASLGVDGYTNLGDDAPKIKMKKLTGTTASSQGGIANIAHGLTSSKILSVDVTIEYGTDLYIPTGYKRIAGYWACKQWGSTNISIYNHATESENILSKPFKLLVTYEE